MNNLNQEILYQIDVYFQVIINGEEVKVHKCETLDKSIDESYFVGLKEEVLLLFKKKFTNVEDIFYISKNDYEKDDFDMENKDRTTFDLTVYTLIQNKSQYSTLTFAYEGCANLDISREYILNFLNTAVIGCVEEFGWKAEDCTSMFIDKMGYDSIKTDIVKSIVVK